MYGSGFGPVQPSIIQFGTYDTNSNTFSADKAVEAVGFMVTQVASSLSRTWTVTFKNLSGQVLSTQTASTTGAGAILTSGVDAVLFGHIASLSNPIASVELSISAGDRNTFIDDFGFTTVAIPEPSAFLLGGLVCTCSGGSNSVSGCETRRSPASLRAIGQEAIHFRGMASPGRRRAVRRVEEDGGENARNCS